MKSMIVNALKRRVLASIGLCYNTVGVSYVLAKYLAQFSKPITLVDVGADDGQFSSSIDRLCGVRKGVLIEPQPLHAAHLRAVKNTGRFEVLEYVVGASRGVSKLEINQFDATSSTLAAKRESLELSGIDVGLREVVECQADTLDSLLRGRMDEPVDLLKIDVQGAELQVLAGAKQCLASTSFVWIEVSFKPLYEGSCLFHEVYEHMQNAGFQMIEIESGFSSPSGERLQADALFRRQ